MAMQGEYSSCHLKTVRLVLRAALRQEASTTTARKHKKHPLVASMIGVKEVYPLAKIQNCCSYGLGVFNDRAEQYIEYEQTFMYRNEIVASRHQRLVESHHVDSSLNDCVMVQEDARIDIGIEFMRRETGDVCLILSTLRGMVNDWCTVEVHTFGKRI